MEAMTTIILTVLCFYGLYALAKAVEREQERRKARSDAAWEANQ